VHFGLANLAVLLRFLPNNIHKIGTIFSCGSAIALQPPPSRNQDNIDELVIDDVVFGPQRVSFYAKGHQWRGRRGRYGRYPLQTLG
jgi:hypothetical protein